MMIVVEIFYYNYAKQHFWSLACNFFKLDFFKLIKNMFLQQLTYEKRSKTLFLLEINHLSPKISQSGQSIFDKPNSHHTPKHNPRSGSPKLHKDRFVTPWLFGTNAACCPNLETAELAVMMIDLAKIATKPAIFVVPNGHGVPKTDFSSATTCHILGRTEL